MKPDDAARLLEHLAQDQPISSPPMRTLIAGGRRIRRRRRTLALGAVAAATAVVMSAGALWLPGPNRQVEPLPATRGPTPGSTDPPSAPVSGPCTATATTSDGRSVALDTHPVLRVRLLDTVRLSASEGCAAEARFSTPDHEVLQRTTVTRELVATGVGRTRVHALTSGCAASKDPACTGGAESLGSVTVIVTPSADYLVCGPKKRRAVLLDRGAPPPSTSVDDAIEAYVDTAPGGDYQLDQASADEAVALVSQGNGLFIAFVSLRRWDNGGWAVDSVVECTSLY